MKTIGSIIFLTAAAALLLAGCCKDEPTKPTIYTVTVVSTTGGTAKAEPATAVEGTTVTLTATPNDGYLFAKWNVVTDNVTFEDAEANPATFAMPAENVEITAEFEEDIDVFTLITDPTLLENCQVFDADGDGKLSRKEAQEVKEIVVYYKGISSFAGIENFPSLEFLACAGNQLSSLDVSKNTALTTLFCGSCSLSSLDVSSNTELTALSCSDNALTALDLSANPKLIELDCSSNKLTSLDISNNTALNIIYCFGNRMSTLNASSMVPDEEGKYTLYCGQQKTASGTGSQTLTITLRDDMKDYWNSTLKGSGYNTSVTLAN